MHLSKNIRLSRSEYISQQFYFITICCYRRRQIFTTLQRGTWLLKTLRYEAAAREFNVHAFCVMPDHIHFLTEGLHATSDLLNLVKSLKLKTSRAFFRKTRRILWQRKFYDHILRRNDDPESVAWYIWMNPVRKGICASAHTYPLSGSFTSAIPPITDPPSIWKPPWKRRL